MEDRLEYIRRKLRGSKVYYSRYSPKAEAFFEVDDAGDDILWMIHEIERLRLITAGSELQRGQRD
ncbi:MAG: hypothetical protein JW820_07140 [Spirochaetales bacterium]|nr:hypothetical protein [Spirochaetales bacterium]